MTPHARQRRLIFSRKGFDSGYGGCPSPVLPDGRMVSLPIPEPDSPIMYGDSMVDSHQSFYALLRRLGIEKLVFTRGNERLRYAVTDRLGTHFDPDLRATARIRPEGWQPLFGQCDAAQSHLAGKSIGVGDVFLFFGWFAHTEERHGQLQYLRSAPRFQAIWGWMEVGEALPAEEFQAAHPWAAEHHPHLIAERATYWQQQGLFRNNFIYMAGRDPGINRAYPAVGVLRYRDACRLTALTVPPPFTHPTPRLWSLPTCFHYAPSPMTYHRAEHWVPYGDRVILKTACKGQEFIIPMNEGIEQWLTDLLTTCMAPSG